MSSFRLWGCSPHDYISNSDDENDGREVSDDGAVSEEKQRCKENGRKWPTRGVAEDVAATTPNARAACDSEGSRSSLSRRSRLSLSDVRRKDDRPVGEKPRARRRKMTVMSNNDMYDDCWLLLSRSLVEFGRAKTTTNH